MKDVEPLIKKIAFNTFYSLLSTDLYDYIYTLHVQSARFGRKKPKSHDFFHPSLAGSPRSSFTPGRKG